MVWISIEQVRELLSKPENISNAIIVASIKHEKSTITDSLAQKAGITNYVLQSMLHKDLADYDQERRFTHKSANVPLYYESGISEKDKNDAYLINLIDSLDYVNFLSEASAVFRITDGVLLVVDYLEGVSLQTEVILHAALDEKVRPVLMINKIDRQFLELQLDAEVQKLQ